MKSPAHNTPCRGLSLQGTTITGSPSDPSPSPGVLSGEEPQAWSQSDHDTVSGVRDSSLPMAAASLQVPPGSWLLVTSTNGKLCLLPAQALGSGIPCACSHTNPRPSQADSTRALCRKWNRHSQAPLVSQLPFLPHMIHLPQPAAF